MSKFVILFNITKGTLQYLALLMPMFHVFAILNALLYLQANHKRYDSPWQVGDKIVSLLQKVELGYVAATCYIEIVA